MIKYHQKYQKKLLQIQHTNIPAITTITITRINNKAEYHQPGDVEISYTKNDKFNNEKK